MLTARITPIAVIALISGVAVFATSARTVVFVDDDAPLGGDGLSWANAHRYLQDALIGAAAGTEIHAAGGTYKPDQDEAGNVTPGERTETFQLITGVGLYGGYRGCPGGDCAGGDPDERDIELYETILSGDLLGNDEAVSCTQDTPDCDSFGGRCIDGSCIIKQNNDENSYQVVTGSDTTETAVLDGFTIAAGNANGPSGEGHNSGSAMYNDHGSPALSNCTFSGNSAAWFGGGMYNGNSSPVLTNCTFSGNSAVFDGGGMVNSVDSSPTLTNCTFVGNSSGRNGGGMYNNYSSPALTNSTFIGNSSGTYGGGMLNTQSNPAVSNCTFIGNSAMRGGGMHNSGSNPAISNCTFSGNSAAWYGGGILNGSSTPALTNCTFSGNSAAWYGGGMYNDSYGSPTLTDCTFSANSASIGGGMYNYRYGTNPTLTNCTFIGNWAVSGAGMRNKENSNSTMTNCTFIGNSANSFGGGVLLGPETSSTLTNCILWANVNDADGSEGGPFSDESAQIYVATGGTATVDHICIQGLIPGGNFDNGTNIGTDPLFVPGPTGCYYLSQTAAGQAVDSPCVDTGDPASPLIDGTTRSDEGLDSGIVDMGYHYPVTGLPLVMGDYDRDADVDLPDFGRFQSCFAGPGPADVTPCCRIFDFEADSDVDLEDYAAIQTAWTGP